MVVIGTDVHDIFVRLLPILAGGSKRSQIIDSAICVKLGYYENTHGSYCDFGNTKLRVTHRTVRDAFWPQYKSVESSLAAKELDTLRNNWLNPPEWTRTEVLEFPGSVGGPWKRYIDPATDRHSRAHTRHSREGGNPAPSPESPAPSAIATVRYPRIVPKDEECAKQQKKRTHTNL
jgi:hypothetical protein